LARAVAAMWGEPGRLTKSANAGVAGVITMPHTT
jgi:hypothetical protein